MAAGAAEAVGSPLVGEHSRVQAIWRQQATKVALTAMIAAAGPPGIINEACQHPEKAMVLAGVAKGCACHHKLPDDVMSCKLDS